MCRISVVVPVYKAAQVIERCAASILSDAPQDLELILVEDGSPDDSGAVCDRLAAGDSRVRVIHQPNGGAGAARNAGLEAARGDYITFVDADDRLLPGLWATALPALRAHRPDLYVFGVQPAVGAPEQFAPGLWQSPAAMPDPAGTILRLQVQGGTLTAPYGKFFRRGAIGHIRFDTSLKVNEDFLFNVQFLADCGPIQFEPAAFYRYENAADGSLSRRLRDDLLEAERFTRGSFAQMLDALFVTPQQKDDLLDARLLHCALAQFGLLAGQKGQLPLGRRIQLTQQIFEIPGAVQALRAQYRADPNRLLALPYRFCLALRWPSLMAAYCALKCRFL